MSNGLDLDFQDLLPPQPEKLPCFATVKEITSQGLKIMVDGDTDAGLKYYKYIASYSPYVGDRVYFTRESGTYLIIGKIAP